MQPLRGGLAPLTLASSVPVSWWLAGGITAANCIAAYAPKGAGTLAASYTNLANPGTNDAAPGVAPTFDNATGWIGNGSAYLNTGIQMYLNYTVIVRFSHVTYVAGVSNYLCGAIGNGKLYGIRPMQGESGGLVNYLFNAAENKVAPGMTSGVLAIAKDGYRDGVLDKSITAATNIAGSLQLFSWGGGSQILACRIQAAAAYNTTITAAQVLAVTNAMNAL